MHNQDFGLNWGVVATYLQRVLSPAWPQDSDGQVALTEWLTRLASGSRCRLLGCCLAIDLASGALAPEDIYEIVTDLRPEGREACIEFARVLREHANAGKWICASRLDCPEPCDEREAYVRVIELEKFIRFYVRPSTGYSSRPDNIGEVMNDWVLDQEGRDLSDITVTWSSPNKRVWVLPQDDYRRICSLADPKHPGTAFQEALGMSYGDGPQVEDWPRFVAILYPIHRDEGWKARQPTALDANWENEPILYISHPQLDGWGRTQHCGNGRYFNGALIRERVHPPFQGLSSEFRLESIGISEPMAAGCQDSILENGFRRFGQALQRTDFVMNAE